MLLGGISVIDQALEAVTVLVPYMFKTIFSLLSFLLWHPIIGAEVDVPDVREALARMSPEASEVIHFDCGKGLPEGGHLQGVQWIQRHGDDFMLLSGSSTAYSYLLTVALNDNQSKPTTITKLLDSPFRHAGGFQVVDGRYIAIGLEDNQTKDVSKVWILDGENTQLDQPLIEIERRGKVERATAGAVALGKIGDQSLLIVGTWDLATLDFYWSNAASWTDPACQFTKRETWDLAKADRSDWRDPGYGSYQNINMIAEATGKQFLAAFCLEGVRNRLDLFELMVDEEIPTSGRLVKRASKVFHCAKTTFKAGGGLHVLGDGSIRVYACSHRDGVIEIFDH